MVRIGIAGIGFMGVTHFKAFQQVKGARVAAIFTRDSRKLQGDWSDVRGNFGGSGGMQDLTGIRCWSRLEDLLADPEIDLVDVCLPSNLHRCAAEEAVKNGKHVLMEKPIALTLEDADAMIGAADQAGRLLLVAQVLRFWPEFAALARHVREETFGRLRALHLKRVIAVPDWSQSNWFSDPARTGGPLVDLHIHDSDFLRWMLGMPESICSSGRGEGDLIDYVVTSYHYPHRNLVVTSQSGAVAQKGAEFEHGYEAYFEKAMITYNSTHSPVPKLVIGPDSSDLDYERGDGFVDELQKAVDAVAAGAAGDDLSAAGARNSLALVLLEKRSVQLGGQPVRVSEELR